MRKISMFLLCSTLLAVPAFAADEPAADNCTDGKVTINGVSYDCAKPLGANNQPATVRADGDISQSADPEHATKCMWIHNDRYGDYACLHDGGFVRCACGITECKTGWRAANGGLKCVEDPNAPRPRDGDNGANGAVQTVSTEGTDDCSDGKVTINGVPYDCAKNENGQYVTRDNAEACHRDQKPNYADKTTWIFWRNNKAGTHACKSGDEYVRCQCGISTCKGDYKPNKWNTECVDADGKPAPAEPEVVAPAGTQEVVTEGAETQQCVNGKQTIGGTEYNCATDANGAIVSVDTTETSCRQIGGVTIANTKTCKWQNAAETDTENVFACKNTEGQFVTCVYRITACVDDTFESRDGGLTCQQKAAAQQGGQQPVISISTLAGRLAKVEGQFGLSKWRTADGEFNTARLASDLTAGVVLGTTGALVTSSVVKKKQVKEGFEALECTVGGQHVGDYGDTFHISGK